MNVQEKYDEAIKKRDELMMLANVWAGRAEAFKEVLDGMTAKGEESPPDAGSN